MCFNTSPNGLNPVQNGGQYLEIEMLMHVKVSRNDKKVEEMVMMDIFIYVVASDGFLSAIPIVSKITVPEVFSKPCS